MPMPNNVPVIDLMMAVPNNDTSNYYDFIKPLLMDEQSRQMFKMPAQYMFKDLPTVGERDDYIAYTIEKMDEFNIEKAMIGVDEGQYETQNEAVLKHPDRFIACYDTNPNGGMDEVRKIRRLKEKYDLKAVTAFPSGLCPQVGVPGPRIPMEPQKVEHLDEICWFFPELRVVMRHGGEPWTDLAWKLMLKYPNLYYMTSAFAPKHYPKEIIHFANTRGADKVMYAGYFPMGLSLERIFGDMPNVPFRDEVWPKFLRENARTVFKLD